MKPAKSVEIDRFHSKKLAEEFSYWIQKSQLRPCETARVFNSGADSESYAVYVVWSTRIGQQRVNTMKAAADAFRWAWILRTGAVARAHDALRAERCKVRSEA